MRRLIDEFHSNSHSTLKNNVCGNGKSIKKLSNWLFNRRIFKFSHRDEIDAEMEQIWNQLTSLSRSSSFPLVLVEINKCFHRFARLIFTLNRWLTVLVTNIESFSQLILIRKLKNVSNTRIKLVTLILIREENKFVGKRKKKKSLTQYNQITDDPHPISFFLSLKRDRWRYYLGSSRKSIQRFFSPWKII